MKKNIIILLVIFQSALFNACKSHTIVDFENDEIPSRALPIDIPDNIAERYKVREILVLPSIQHVNVGDSTYLIRIDAFSKNKVDLTLKNINCEIDGSEVALRKDFTFSKFPVFKFNENYKLFYSQINGNAFTIPNPQDKKRIDVAISIEVNVAKKGNVEGVIQSAFFPKKRKYLE